MCSKESRKKVNFTCSLHLRFVYYMLYLFVWYLQYILYSVYTIHIYTIWCFCSYVIYSKYCIHMLRYSLWLQYYVCQDFLYNFLTVLLKGTVSWDLFPYFSLNFAPFYVFAKIFDYKVQNLGVLEVIDYSDTQISP